MMNGIRSWLYIGKFRDTLDRELLETHAVNAMLQLAELVNQPGMTSLYLAVDDGVPVAPALMKQGIDFIRAHKANGETVLVTCGAGISRSTTFALAALHEEEGLNLIDAFHDVRRHHPQAMPHPALWDSLFSYYKAETTFKASWEEIYRIRNRSGRQQSG